MDTQPVYTPASAQVPPQKSPSVRTSFFTGPKELTFAFFAMICGMMMFNFIISGGFNLGFAIAMGGYILCASIYQFAAGGRVTAYSLGMLILSLVITAGFARSGDGFVKFIMVLFLTVSVNLGLCITTGQNRRNPSRFHSLGDVFRTKFFLTYGQFPRAFRGLNRHLRQGGSLGKRIGATAIGIAILIPLLGIVVPLLKKADAAFTGLVEMLPRFDFGEAFFTVSFGIVGGMMLYTRNVALRHYPKQPDVQPRTRRGVYPVIINTVLMGLCGVYVLYLVSQLAYFAGGLSGFLPENFTMAEYARRGFFEMAVLTGIDLAIMLLAMCLVRKQDGKAPLLTRALCVVIGLATLFMVFAASGKMLMYIGGYGLTRMRVMTELVTIFLGIAIVVMMVWLFAPKLPYMKILVTLALLMGAATIWADVDTVVASYNVHAYQTGKLEQVDVHYLSTLNDGAVPYIARLTDDADPEVADAAKDVLEDWYWQLDDDYDFRGWNYVKDLAEDHVIKPKK